MQELKQIVRAIILTSLPLLGVLSALFYFNGGPGPTISDALEYWALMVLVIINFLLLLHTIFRGERRRWLPAAFIIFAAMLIHLSLSPLNAPPPQRWWLQCNGLKVLNVARPDALTRIRLAFHAKVRVLVMTCCSMYSLMISSVTLPKLPQKYPRAHRCLPQNFFRRCGNSCIIL